jgi:hypothetical protein
MNRVKILAVLGWAAAGVMLLAGAKQGDELTTRRLVIQGARGRTCITLEGYDGEPTITLAKPRDNEARMILGVVTRDRLPYLTMYDVAKKKRMQITISPEGPQVRLFDEDGRTLAVMPR